MWQNSLCWETLSPLEGYWSTVEHTGNKGLGSASSLSMTNAGSTSSPESGGPGVSLCTRKRPEMPVIFPSHAHEWNPRSGMGGEPAGWQEACRASNDAARVIRDDAASKLGPQVDPRGRCHVARRGRGSCDNSQVRGWCFSRRVNLLRFSRQHPGETKSFVGNMLFGECKLKCLAKGWWKAQFSPPRVGSWPGSINTCGGHGDLVHEQPALQNRLQGAGGFVLGSSRGVAFTAHPAFQLLLRGWTCSLANEEVLCQVTRSRSC